MKLLLLAEAARACGVCFGDDGSGLVLGLQWGIVLLLTCTASLVGGLFYTIYRIEAARADD